MNVLSSEFEGDNCTVRSGDIGRDILEHSSCGSGFTTDLYSLNKFKKSKHKTMKERKKEKTMTYDCSSRSGKGQRQSRKESKLHYFI